MRNYEGTFTMAPKSVKIDTANCSVKIAPERLIMDSKENQSEKCPHCGNTFVKRAPYQIYCSRRCGEQAYRKRKREEKQAKAQHEYNLQHNQTRLDLLAKAAKDAGMSYGHYVLILRQRKGDDET